MDTAVSSSALIANKAVDFFSFRFSQISSRPEAKMVIEGSRKGSSAVSVQVLMTPLLLGVHYRT